MDANHILQYNITLFIVRVKSNSEVHLYRGSVCLCQASSPLVFLSQHKQTNTHSTHRKSSLKHR